jgi:hypothetical protein
MELESYRRVTPLYYDCNGVLTVPSLKLKGRRNKIQTLQDAKLTRYKHYKIYTLKYTKITMNKHYKM